MYNFFIHMRNFSSLKSLFFLLISFSVVAQSNVIKFQPVPLANNTISIGFERKLGEKSSFQLNGDYASESDFGFKSTWSGFSAEYRIFGLISTLNKDGIVAPEGFFVAPTVGLRFFKDVDLDDPDSEYTERYSFLQAGGLVGYQWLPTFKNGSKPLALEVSVGLLGGFMLNGETEDYEDYELSSRFGIGIVPTINIGIGFAFGK
jgi:hypothetical protein